jgi:hypothetical protein
MGMLIIINSGDPITNPGNYTPSSNDLYYWRKLGEKISNKFLSQSEPILLTPSDVKSDFVGDATYPYIKGENFLPPIKNLVEWIQEQTRPVVIILNKDKANQFAQEFWVDTTYGESLDISMVGPNEAIVINPPHNTVVRA